MHTRLPFCQFYRFHEFHRTSHNFFLIIFFCLLHFSPLHISILIHIFVSMFVSSFFPLLFSACGVLMLDYLFIYFFPFLIACLIVFWFFFFVFITISLGAALVFPYLWFKLIILFGLLTQERAYLGMLWECLSSLNVSCRIAFSMRLLPFSSPSFSTVYFFRLSISQNILQGCLSMTLCRGSTVLFIFFLSSQSWGIVKRRLQQS